jgi:hypothetical protein
MVMSFIICTLDDDEVREDEMGGACSAQRE